MKTYRLKKDLPWFNKWAIFNDFWLTIYDWKSSQLFDKNQYLNDSEWFEEVVEKKIDFSKFISRSIYKDLIIFWNWYLISWRDWDISYYKNYPSGLTDEISYIECELKDLEKWDVFILKNIVDVWRYNKFHFKIYVWMYQNQYLHQCLTGYGWIEVIHWSSFINDKVYKFLRE